MYMCRQHYAIHHDPLRWLVYENVIKPLRAGLHLQQQFAYTRYTLKTLVKCLHCVIRRFPFQ